MSDKLRKTLKDVVSGTQPADRLLAAIQDYLKQDDADHAAVRAVLNAAEQLGLDTDIIRQGRDLIGATAFNIGDPTKAVSQDDATKLLDEDSTEVYNPDATRKDIGDPTEVIGSDDDRTTAIDPDRTLAVGDDDRTVAAGDDDRTVAAGDEDRTQAVAGDDPFSMTDATVAPRSSGGPDLGPGSVLKGRFRLEVVIGQGGMGAVYKAVDLLKVEARDRNPYIAVKLLIGDFKEHPEAFIALQRESTKAQRLAHPNIATVYDFDRDGETVYMTMELMQGVELAKYIKKIPAGGLPVEDANRIIEQLCAGLAYAHARGLVHSDFKPGNAFLLDDGSVKLLDFGIARASSTKADAEGEQTVFDPGELGALTPAYATIDMFEGKDPDPRDDIYALACVAYELYTGAHPFKKMSAVKARDKKLKPAAVPKLTKRQNRALMRGLALAREDRIPSVDTFWDELRRRKDYTWQIVGGSLAAAALLGALLYNPIMDFIHEREHAEILVEVDSRDEKRLLSALGRIDVLTPERQRIVAERGREPIVAHFENRAEERVDHAAGRYDYPAALSYIEELDRYFPDSFQVAQLRQSLLERRNTLVSEIDGKFTELLEAGEIMPREDAEDITDLVAILRQSAPDNQLLDDLRLVTAYAEQAQAAVTANDYRRAGNILEVAISYAPSEASLLNLQDQVQTELRRLAETQMVADLRSTLQRARPGLTDIAAFRQVRDDMAQLGEIRPDDELVVALNAPLKRAFEAEMTRLTSATQWAEADVLLSDFARLFDIDYLVEARTALTNRQMAAGFDTRTDGDRVARLEQHRNALTALLDAPVFDDGWNRALDNGFKDLTAALTANAEWFGSLRERIAQIHIESARELVTANRFSAAAGRLDNGQRFLPDLPAFISERNALNQAQEAFRVAEEQRLQARRVEAAKETLLVQARANNIAEATLTFNILRRDLPADDPFIVETAPRALAEAHLNMAAAAADREDFNTATRLARAGLELAPRYQPLLDVVEVYQGRERRAALMTLAGNATVQNMGQIRQQLDQVRQALPNEVAAINRDVLRNLETRIRAVERTDIAGAHALRDAALGVFPGNQQLTGLTLRAIPRPSVFAPRIRASFEAGRLTEARQLLVQGQREEPNHVELEALPGMISARETEANRFYQNALTEQQRGNQTGAQNELQRAIAIWADNADYQDMMRRFAGTRAPERTDDGSVPCTSALAGHGRVGRGACYDMPVGQRGPTMVVISAPAGGESFAIGKYEISNNDFNHFCTTTGRCQPSGEDAQFPVVGISIQQADAYIAWLAETTGKSYRLPTEAEWVHAAGGGGNVGPSGDANCRVTQGGNIIKGHSLLRVSSGADNGWGVRNHVGNAQEWVRTGGTLTVRGGAFQDPLTNCGINLTRPHSGAADNITSFRLVRGLD